MKIQKVVITGVTGFFGSALAKELLIREVAVYGVGRNRTKLNTEISYPLNLNSVIIINYRI